MIRAASTKSYRTLIERARNVLEIEAKAIHALVNRIDDRFVAAVKMIFESDGRLLVSGIGKSGHIARKIASTFSSTGTPAYFVHPAEASHGDLGMIGKGDVLIAISYSGSSPELIDIVPLVKRRAKLIAITGHPHSTLGREADVVLDARVQKEACPHNLAPTASTTAALALGDALALALLDKRGFSAYDFARSHPRGSLHGKALPLIHVSDVMRRGKAVPFVGSGTTAMRAVVEMSRGKLGMTAVLDNRKRVLGIVTDGDVRRALEGGINVGKCRVEKMMTPKPRTIRPDVLAVEAVQLMETHKINQLLVIDRRGALIGALNMHDLFRAKVI